VDGISAATILGDGTVAMILDVTGLIRMAHAGATRPTPALPDRIQDAGRHTGNMAPTIN